MRQICVKMPEHYVEAIDEYCEKTGKTRSEAIREAIYHYIIKRIINSKPKTALKDPEIIIEEHPY